MVNEKFAECYLMVRNPLGVRLRFPKNRGTPEATTMPESMAFAFVLALIGLGAKYFAARRSTRVDPTIALR